MRDRLKLELDQLAKTPDTPFFSEPWKQHIQRQKSQTLLQQLENVTIRIQIEERAKNNWDESAKLATQAVLIGRTAKADPASWEQSQYLWHLAINTLRQIPHGSFLANRAIDKTIEYQGNLTVATYELQIARSLQKTLEEQQQKKELQRQELEKKEQARQELERQEFEKKELARKELERQEFEKKELARKELEKQELARKELERKQREKQELARQELARQELARQELARQELARQELARQELERNQPTTPPAAQQCSLKFT